MSNKKEIQQPGLNTEEAKDLELDEQPKPTRKVSHPSTPISNKDEPSIHDKKKRKKDYQVKSLIMIALGSSCLCSNS